MRKRWWDFHSGCPEGYFHAWFETADYNRSQFDIEKIIHDFLYSQKCDGYVTSVGKNEWFRYPSVSTIVSLINYVIENNKSPDWNMTPSIWNTGDDCDAYSEYEDSENSEDSNNNGFTLEYDSDGNVKCDYTDTCVCNSCMKSSSDSEVESDYKPDNYSKIKDLERKIEITERLIREAKVDNNYDSESEVKIEIKKKPNRKKKRNGNISQKTEDEPVLEFKPKKKSYYKKRYTKCVGKDRTTQKMP